MVISLRSARINAKAVPEFAGVEKPDRRDMPRQVAGYSLYETCLTARITDFRDGRGRPGRAPINGFMVRIPRGGGPL